MHGSNEESVARRGSHENQLPGHASCFRPYPPLKSGSYSPFNRVSRGLIPFRSPSLPLPPSPSNTMSLPSHRPPPLASPPFSTGSYFQTQNPPPDLADKAAITCGFVDRWKGVAGKKVVLVTVTMPSFQSSHD